MRAIKYTLLGLLALLLVVLLVSAVIVGGLLYTEAGSRWAVTQVDARLDALEIGAFRGRLGAQAVFENVHWAGEPGVRLREVAISWDLTRLLAATFHLQRLAVSGAEVVLPAPDPAAPATEPDAPVPLPREVKLPIAVIVDDLDVRDLTIETTQHQKKGAAGPANDAGSASSVQTIDQVTVQGVQLQDGELVVGSLVFSGMGVAAKGEARVETRFPYPLTVNLAAKASLPDLPPAEASVALQGDLKRLGIEATAAEPYALSAEVRVQPNIVVPPSPLRQPYLKVKSIFLSGNVSVSSLDTQRLGLTPEAFRLSANTEIEGSLAALKASLTAELNTERYPPLALAAQLRVQDTGLTVNQLTLRSPEIATQVSAQGAMDWAGALPNLDVQLRWQDVRWPLQGERVDVASPEGMVLLKGTVEDLVADLNMAVNAEGQVIGQVRRRQAQLSADLNWRALAYPQGAPQVSSERGHLQFEGTPAAFTTALSASVTTPDFPEGQVTLTGAAVDRIFSLEGLNVDVAGMTLAARGRVDYQQALQSSLSVTVADFDPSLLVPAFPGRLGAELQAAFAMTEHGYRVNLERLSARGTLRSQPLSLDAQVAATLPKGDSADLLQAFQQKQASVALKQLALKLGQAAVNLEGTLTDRVASRWAVDVPDLGAVLPGAQGRLQSEGAVRGQLLTPTVRISASGRQLGWQQVKVADFNVAGDLFFSGEKPSDLTAKINGVQVNDTQVSQVSAAIQGVQSQHAVSVSVDAEAAAASLGAEGRFADGVWQFVLNQGEVRIPQMPVWTLTEPASGVVSAQAQQLARHCWRSQTAQAARAAQVCWQGQQADGQVVAEVRVADLPASHFRAWLPEGLAVNTLLSADATLEHDLNQVLPELAATMGLSAGSVQFENMTQLAPDLQTIPLRESEVTLNITEGAIALAARAGFSAEDSLTATISLPAEALPIAKRSVRGDIDFQMRDLRLLDHLVDPIDQLKGQVQADLRIRGSLAAPVVSGGVSLKESSVSVIDAGLSLKDIEAEARVTPDGANVRLAARSGEGQLALTGRSGSDLTRVKDLMQADFSAQLRGQRFRVLNKRQQQVEITPDLTIELKDRAVHVDGVVRIPYADISNISATPPSGVSVSEDQVILPAQDQPAPEQQPPASAPLPVHATVRLEMGDAVHFNEFGLDARFGGAIVIKEQPGQVTSASGEFRIEEGRFRKLGQDLVIRKGRVIFAGPVTKPGVDLEAVRVIDSSLVTGIRARGPLSQIEQFTLFSEPGGLTQADILSYITTGRPLAGSSEGEASVVTQASMALAMTGGKYLTENFGDKLGVDEIGIDTAPGEDTSQAALTIGKYLSPKLYVSSGVGLFQPITTLKLRYSINEKWKFVSEASGAKSSADFVYEIESGD